jgi:hypothetical protein
MAPIAEPLKLPSDRSFGVTFAVVLFLTAGWLAWKSMPGSVWLLSGAGAFLAVAWIRPRLLRPLNRLWMAFGLLLHRIVSPIVLGAMYFGLFTPIALAFRLKGRDVMRRTADPDASSYWIDRKPPGPPPESLPNHY